LRANLKGEADIVFLTGGINQQFIMGRPGINSREELAGKRIGFVGDGGLNDVLVKFIIEKLADSGIEGLREEPIAGGSDVQVLLNGACDAVVITPPESIDAQRKGCKVLVDFSEYGLNYALGGIAAHRDYVQRHPEITRKFIKAYVEGMRRYRTDREFTVNVQAEYSGNCGSNRCRGNLRPDSAGDAAGTLPRGLGSADAARFYVQGSSRGERRRHAAICRRSVHPRAG
jgi:ABC-type nitrate/sulfonate/bicarbonate transport system substrate-binding protein